jgi:hypothetical protein
MHVCMWDAGPASAGIGPLASPASRPSRWRGHYRLAPTATQWGRPNVGPGAKLPRTAAARARQPPARRYTTKEHREPRRRRRVALWFAVLLDSASPLHLDRSLNFTGRCHYRKTCGFRGHSGTRLGNTLAHDNGALEQPSALRSRVPTAPLSALTVGAVDSRRARC